VNENLQIVLPSKQGILPQTALETELHFEHLQPHQLPFFEGAMICEKFFFTRNLVIYFLKSFFFATILAYQKFPLFFSLGFSIFSHIIGVVFMSKVCEVTGKRPKVGRKYTIRGIAKKKKGIGLKITGKTKRRFIPNIMTKRFWFEDENRFIKLKVSANAIRIINKKGLSTVVREMRKNGAKI
jgi:large subunit ribosomal protein L28